MPPSHGDDQDNHNDTLIVCVSPVNFCLLLTPPPTFPFLGTSTEVVVDTAYKYPRVCQKLDLDDALVAVWHIWRLPRGVTGKTHIDKTRPCECPSLVRANNINNRNTIEFTMPSMALHNLIVFQQDICCGQTWKGRGHVRERGQAVVQPRTIAAAATVAPTIPHRCKGKSYRSGAITAQDTATSKQQRHQWHTGPYIDTCCQSESPHGCITCLHPSMIDNDGTLKHGYYKLTPLLRVSLMGQSTLMFVLGVHDNSTTMVLP